MSYIVPSPTYWNPGPVAYHDEPQAPVPGWGMRRGMTGPRMVGVGGLGAYGKIWYPKPASWYYLYWTGAYTEFPPDGRWIVGEDLCSREETNPTISAFIYDADLVERPNRKKYGNIKYGTDSIGQVNVWIRYSMYSDDDGAWVIENLDQMGLRRMEGMDCSKVPVKAPYDNPWGDATKKPPPIGRPKPTKAMLDKIAADRAKLKAFPKPTMGPPADVSGRDFPWLAVGIGTAVAATLGVGLLWTRHRSQP